jgi:hypothetical protein
MAAVYPVASPFNTNPSYSGSFIPQLWSGKLNAKYYVDNQLTEIVNTNWEGEIKNQGDTVRIRMAPNLTISDYTVGTGIASYEVPVPIYQDFTIDKGKMFHFQVNDVLEAQADMDLMNMFMEDAAKQLKIAIADEVYFNTFLGAKKGATGDAATYGAAVGNFGATAGVKSSALNLGTPDAPIDTGTAANLLNLILKMGAALDEQNVPESGRWLLMSPYDRQVLMQSNLAQAYFTGDQSSIVRTGKIGMIDRFTVYVSNMLPRRAADKAWVSGQTDPSTGAAWDTTDNNAQRMIVAGTKDAITHASQVTKTEQLRNQSDFGDLVRGLNVYGRKVVKPEALTIGVVR